MSMSLADCLGPRIKKVSITFSFDMHNQGGRLYVTSMIGQQLDLLLRLENGLKPSVAIPNLSSFVVHLKSVATLRQLSPMKHNRLDDASFHHYFYGSYAC